MGEPFLCERLSFCAWKALFFPENQPVILSAGVFRLIGGGNGL